MVADVESAEEQWKRDGASQRLDFAEAGESTPLGASGHQWNDQLGFVRVKAGWVLALSVAILLASGGLGVWLLFVDGGLVGGVITVATSFGVLLLFALILPYSYEFYPGRMVVRCGPGGRSCVTWTFQLGHFTGEHQVLSPCEGHPPAIGCGLSTDRRLYLYRDGSRLAVAVTPADEDRFLQLFRQARQSSVRWW